jgi:hypothetical protein
VDKRLLENPRRHNSRQSERAATLLTVGARPDPVPIHPLGEPYAQRTA